jgi:hypothetical protein
MNTQSKVFVLVCFLVLVVAASIDNASYGQAGTCTTKCYQRKWNYYCSGSPCVEFVWWTCTLCPGDPKYSCVDQSDSFGPPCRPSNTDNTDYSFWTTCNGLCTCTPGTTIAVEANNFAGTRTFQANQAIDYCAR